MDGIFQENNIQLVMCQDKSNIVQSHHGCPFKQSGGHPGKYTHYRRNKRSKTLAAENLNSK
jgi:hypothetical protein